VARVHLLATGGTIASRRTDDGLSATTPAAELLAAAGPLPGLEVTVSDLTTVPSFALTGADVRGLLRAVRERLADGVDGVVVTHGTDTMEESAFLADLVHDDPRPVVFTGAQRPFDAPAPDGPANLADALRVAADPAARDLGALLAFDGLVFAARGVRKVETLRGAAFGAPGRGPVLRVAGGVPVLVCSRVPSGPVAPLYAGGGASLARDGALFGGDLSPWQGRLLLAAALALDPQDPGRVLAGRL
jgi:L-asparaginase